MKRRTPQRFNLNGHRDALVVLASVVVSLITSLVVAWLDADRQDRRISAMETVDSKQSLEIAANQAQLERMLPRLAGHEEDLSGLRERIAKASSAADTAAFESGNANVRLDGIYKKLETKQTK